MAEHFIPQFYLKQFSPDNKCIYQYDVLAGKQMPVPVPIKSICYENNLYEFRDNEGIIVYQNLIEKMLSIYEGIFARTFRSIIAKTQHPSNSLILSFLSTDEKAFLIFFISTLILRNPSFINTGIEKAKEVFGSGITSYQAKNLTLKMCLPLYKEIDIEEKTLLNVILSWFEDLSFQVCVSDKDVFLTSDLPATIICNRSPHQIKEVFLPISPRIMLHMVPEANTPKNGRNRMVVLSNKTIRTVCKEAFPNCQRWVYSKAPLTEQEIRMIEKGRHRK